MQKRALILAAALLGGGGLSAEAAAQDYLGIHLDTIREENLRRHQQGRAARSEEPREKYVPPISGKARHVAMRRHLDEYSRIRREQGYRAADQWLAEQVAAGR